MKVGGSMSSLSEIITERSGRILDVAFNRPAKKNAMTMSMYAAFADLLNDADTDEGIRVVLVHGTGDSFTAGNDLGDFLKNPPGSGDSPQQRLIDALINFDKPLVAAVHGAAVGSGTTMLTHFDFVYAGESAKFQMPFVNLGLVPDQTVLATARETAEKLAQKPAGALVASKQLLKRSFREQLAAAAKAESQEFTSRVRSAEAKEAFTAFFDKHRTETR